ncbi:MAG: ABC transporter substrate-binding protein [Acidimicrobiaceae bacterium]
MRKQLIALLALLLSFALVAVACGSDDDDASDDSSSSASASSSADEPAEDDDEPTADMSESNEETEANSDDADSGSVDTGPVAGGTLLIQSTQVPRHLNGTVQSGYATAVPGTQLNASPLLIDENFEPQPYLAESWEISDDGLSVTLNLVEGAVFHDGEPITSEDVAFSITTSRDNHPFRTMFAPVTSVDTPDDLTAVINLSEPHPAILLAMSPGLLPIIPEHVYNDGQEIREHPCNAGECFVGSGPFTLAEYEAGSIIRLEAFEDFFIPERPYLDEIIIEIVPDPATITLGLENGTTDLALPPGEANIVRLQGNDDVIVTAEGHAAVGQVNWLEFNLADPALSNVEVRRAIADGIDREFLTEVLQQGTTIATTTGIHQGSPFHNPDTEHYGAGVEAAQQRLADAGVDASSISFAVDYIPPVQLAQAEYVVQVLQDIGFEAELNISPDFPTWATRVATGEHQMTLNNVWNWGDPVIGVHRSYLSTNNVGAIWTNNTGYNNPQVDALLAQAGSTFDVDERIDLYHQMQTIVNEDVPMVYLSNGVFWQAFQPRVQNPPIGVWGQLGPMHEVWLAE